MTSDQHFQRQLSKLLLNPLDLASHLASAAWQRQTHDDEQHFVKTADNWQLSLRRIQSPKRQFKIPVLLQHGLGACHRAYNFPTRSLAQYLAQCGFDVWLSDLRGRLKSRFLGGKKRPSWSVDDYVDRDLPSFIQFIREYTGSPKINIVGHSMGGVLIYMYGVRHGTDAFQAAVTTAASLDYTKGKSGFRKLLKLQSLVQKMATVPYGSLSRLMSFAVGRVPNNVEKFSYNRDNMPGWLARQWYATVFQNISPDVLLSLAKTFSDAGFTHSDGYCYNTHCEQFKAPILAMVGTADQQCRPAAVTTTFNKLGSTEKKLIVFGEQTTQRSYGHADILVGKDVESSVWPEMKAWLQAFQPEAANTAQ